MEILMFSNKLEKKIISNLNLKDKKVYSFAVMKDSKLIAAAIDSKRNYTFNTLFELACASKPYLAIAIMQLVEKRIINLDEPVCTYIPKFKMKDERYKDITVRMLMTYSAGFQADTYKNKMSKKVKLFNKEVLYKNLQNEELRFKPGAFSVYSNTCYELLTALLEEITGENYLDYIDRFLKKLDISIDIRKKNIEDFYYDDKYGIICWDLGGAGALVSNAIDLVKFANIFNEPQGILTSESIDEMTKVQVNKYLNSAYNPARGYGLGWDSVDSEREYEDKVLIKTGRLLSASTAICVIPKHKIAVTLIVSNDCVKFSKMSSTLKDLLKTVLDSIYEELNISKIEINKNKIISIENKIHNNPGYLKGTYYSLTNIFKVDNLENKLIIYKYSNNSWEKYDTIKYLLKYNDYLISDNYKYCFERKNNATFFIEDGEAIAQKEDVYSENSKYWLNKIGEKYIAFNLSKEIKWEYCNVSFEIKRIIKNEPLILEFKNSNVKMPFMAKNLENTTSFLNIPNDNIREAYIPVGAQNTNQKTIHFKEYDYININNIEYLKSGTVKVTPEKNVIFKINTNQKMLSIEQIDELDILLLDDELKIVNELIDCKNKHIELNKGYIIIIANKELELNLEINKGGCL